MILQKARRVFWKKWAAKHEYEELKEGIWLEPALALLREKTKEDWTEKHRSVVRKLFLEGGWAQQRLLAQKNTGSTTAQKGTRSEGRSSQRKPMEQVPLQDGKVGV